MIDDIVFVSPAARLSAEEIAAWTGSEVGFIRDKVGIQSRAFLAADEPPSSLAATAIRAMIERGGIDPADVGFLIVVTQTPDYRIPHMSAQLQDMCGLPDTVMAFDMALGCSGYVYALSVARGLLLSGHRKGLIVTCDPYSKIMGRHDKATVTVFGDGASCTIVSAEGIDRIGAFDFGTDGSGGKDLTFAEGGGARPLNSVHGAGEPPAKAPSLHMDGRSILNFMLTRVPRSVDHCLELNGLTRDDIDYFVFHQASRYMLELLTRRMELDPARVPIMIETTGNTVSSTIPYVLGRLGDDGVLAGKRVLVSGFGVGLSWATTVIRFSA